MTGFTELKAVLKQHPCVDGLRYKGTNCHASEETRLRVIFRLEPAYAARSTGGS